MNDKMLDDWITGEFFERGWYNTFICCQCEEECEDSYGLYTGHGNDYVCSEECYKQYKEELEDVNGTIMSLHRS